MKRITYKVNCLNSKYFGDYLKAISKLCQIEDLEEELGLSAYKILERIKEKRGK